MLIAEIGNNHEGSIERAKRLIELAAPHADAVKFQIFRAERLVHPSLPSRVEGHKTQLERMKSLEFTDEQWHELREYCQKLGVEFMATCFDVDTLNTWAPYLKRIKIASGDLTYEALCQAAAATHKPVLLSTGGASHDEIRRAAEIIPTHRLTVLHCVSRYPCVRPALGNIRILQALYPAVGYSCHTPGIDACYAAAVLGAKVIEKHFTDERRAYGDHVHSALPQELAELSRRIKDLAYLMGNERDTADDTLRRGAYARRSITRGEQITDNDIIWLRPNRGRPGPIAQHDYQPMDAVNG